MTEPTYVIGIDLGTTNSVVAYTTVSVELGKKSKISVFEIPQLVDVGVVEIRSLLPSFIFLPGKHDVPENSLQLPWNKQNDSAVGEFARERGAEIPQRLISSSKSWLCHTQVDRNKAILPWEAPDEVPKRSPVQAASDILKHIRDAWNHHFASKDEKHKMEYQDVLLTVPASFDAVARDLTVKAAEMAGLSNVTLLEEPQAAFYAWIESSGEKWREKVKKGDLVLVCDVGGGTSDFSLISVSEQDGDLELERVAVGNHLLIGGDNMDIALAYTVSQKISGKSKKMDAWQMRTLWHACRKAKEKLLTDQQIKELPITVLGRGSGLIGGTKKTNLTQEELNKIILDGFFPKCDKNKKPVINQAVGIKEVGLAYEADPSITHHIAHFLSRRQQITGKYELPTAVLFNGGVMKPESIRKHVLNVITSWKDSDHQSVREIESQNFELAVAKGAAYYGLARRGKGIRIRGGLNKTYYIGVAASLPAVPGIPIPIKAVCVSPFGMEEGTSAVLSGREFILVVGEPVKFDFLGSSIRLQDSVGTVVDDWEDEVEAITTIETTLDGVPGTSVPVILEMKATEVGTLELWCVSVEDSSRRWKLEFNVREKEPVESD